MEYNRLLNQLRIHWCWLKENEDHEEVYKILKIWIDTDVEKSQAENNKSVLPGANPGASFFV